MAAALLSVLSPVAAGGTLVEVFRVKAEGWSIDWIKRHADEIAARSSSRAACALWVEEVPE